MAVRARAARWLAWTTGWLTWGFLLSVAAFPAATARASGTTVVVGGRTVTFPGAPARAILAVGHGFRFASAGGSGEAELLASPASSGAVVLTGTLEAVPQTAKAGAAPSLPLPRHASVEAAPGEVLLVSLRGRYALMRITDVSTAGVAFNDVLSPPAPGAAGLRPTAAVGGAAVGTPGPPARPVDLGRFVPLAAPNGEYNLRVPVGWSFVGANTENPVEVAPRGQSEPELGLVLVDVSAPLEQRMTQAFLHPTGALQRCLVQAGLSRDYGCLAPYYAAYEPRMNGAYAAQVLLDELAAAGRAPSRVKLTPLGDTQAVVWMAHEAGGAAVDAVWMVRVFAEPDLAVRALAGLEGAEAYHDYALVASCSAAQSQMAAVLPLCTASLDSFRDVSWPLQAVEQAMQQQEQAAETLFHMGLSSAGQDAQTSAMLSDFGSAMQSMQADQFLQQSAAAYWSGEGEIATLGGDTMVQDPATGEVDMVPGGFAGYCDTAAGSVEGYNGQAAPSGCVGTLEPVGPGGP